jgi:hypothetical protein
MLYASSSLDASYFYCMKYVGIHPASTYMIFKPHYSH